MEYEIIFGYQKNDSLRASFNKLAEKTFGLNFENWYQSGYWNDKYIPYSIVSNGNILANVSVNIINCSIKGSEKHYIQLGTVMTDDAYRNQGFSRRLMEKIFSDYQNIDGIFLFANDEVLNFYPKFGFKQADEYRYRTTLNTDSKSSVTHIPMNNKKDFTEFLKIKKSHVSRSPVITDTDDLLMFYLTQFMQECVYKVNNMDVYVIAEQDGDSLTVFDILSNDAVDPVEICKCFGREIKNVNFAFIPENSAKLEKYLYKEDDTTFFVLGETITNDLPDILSFPALVHA